MLNNNKLGVTSNYLDGNIRLHGNILVNKVESSVFRLQSTDHRLFLSIFPLLPSLSHAVKVRAMSVQMSGLRLPPTITTAVNSHPILRSQSKPIQMSLAASAVLPLSQTSTIQIVGGKAPSWYRKETAGFNDKFEDSQEESDWPDLDADLHYWTRLLRPVQWYPGHIAKTEKELKEQLKLMDVVIEVRDARIPLATSHPQMESWLGNRKRILVLNREDMISTADRNAWAAYFAKQGTKVVFSNGQLGVGAIKLGRLAKSLAVGVNVKRRAKGLLPRAVRAGIVGYPNVGKSSLINRLLKRRMCPAAPRPGVTRQLKWVHFGKDLELLDSPGIIPMRIMDQTAAIKLAICDDIGERSYNVVDVAAILVQMLMRIPTVGSKALYKRYKIDADGLCGKIFVEKLSLQLFNGDVHQAAFRLLTDFRKGKFGWVALERPPK
ncbi:GTP binding domain [Macleaya cordata]|uniref:GTP binding domain n=1 Tax=Macleaya cordata TaxID=56857 RepID=A0A200PTK4_MACCD|nr:GTP binding domain [Macleaya cordata]